MELMVWRETSMACASCCWESPSAVRRERTSFRIDWKGHLTTWKGSLSPPPMSSSLSTAGRGAPAASHRRRLAVERGVGVRARVLERLEVGEDRRVREPLAQGGLDALHLVVAPLHRPRARDQDVQGDERAPAGLPGAQGVEAYPLALERPQRLGDLGLLLLAEGLVHQPADRAPDEAHAGDDDVGGDHQGDDGIQALPARQRD